MTAFRGGQDGEELNALSPPPPSPFTVTVEVTMANDEGQTATATLTYQTSYDRDEPAAEPPAQPTLRPTPPGQTVGRRAPPGVLVIASAAQPNNGVFDNAGTNPRITTAVFSTTAYYNTHMVRRDRLFVEAKSTDELNALSPPPPSPFTVTVEVTMTNDEGQTATATLTYKTSYDRVEPTPEPPVQSAASRTEVRNAPTGTLIYTYANGVFDNAGTNPRITDAVLSNPDI